MTPAEQHRQERDRVAASLLLAPTTATRHDVYPRRRPFPDPVNRERVDVGAAIRAGIAAVEGQDLGEFA